MLTQKDCLKIADLPFYCFIQAEKINQIKAASIL